MVRITLTLVAAIIGLVVLSADVHGKPANDATSLRRLKGDLKEVELMVLRDLLETEEEEEDVDQPKPPPKDGENKRPQDNTNEEEEEGADLPKKPKPGLFNGDEELADEAGFKKPYLEDLEAEIEAEMFSKPSKTGKGKSSGSSEGDDGLFDDVAELGSKSPKSGKGKGSGSPKSFEADEDEDMSISEGKGPMTKIKEELQEIKNEKGKLEKLKELLGKKKEMFEQVLNKIGQKFPGKKPPKEEAAKGEKNNGDKGNVEEEVVEDVLEELRELKAILRQ